MCGICGIIDYKANHSGEDRRKQVEKMNQAQFHRGPDESGAYHDQLASLAMRRLAIIDLKGGQQPIFNETKDILVFFNGEIYNHQELRSELRAKGHIFQTQADTEVIVHLYEEHGVDMLPKLKGMFAFCLYNLKNESFFFARDRFGEKPFFYHWNDQVFSFASEVQALLNNRAIPRILNSEALPYYLRTSLVPEPITLLQGIFSLPPGHYAKLSSTGLEVSPYFQINYPVESQIKSESEAIAFVKPLLEQAVKRQTISDVPIGAFLSGGIDSSTIVALLQQQSDKKIQTFNVRFEDEAYDESPIARKVAAFWNTDHHEITVPNYDFTEAIFWTIIQHVGLPFRDSSAIPTFLISKEIGQHVKVALSGDGGDELFGGYSLFQWYQRILSLKQIPTPLRQVGNRVLKLTQRLPGLNSNSKLRQLQRAANTSLLMEDEIPIALNEFFSKNISSRLIRDFSLDYKLGFLKAYPTTASQWSPLRKIMYYRAFHTLPSNMLVKVDRMSMANSLEVRAPFLDPDLFEAAARLPDHLLIQHGKGKHLLRKIMEKELPKEVFNHPKKGFSIPLYKYQNKAFQQLAHRLLFKDNPFKELFDQGYLEQIYHQGLHHKKNTAQLSVFQSAHRLWMLMQLFGWGKYFDVKLG